VSGSVVTPKTRQRVKRLGEPVALALGRLGLTPNALTLIGFGIAILAAIAAAGQSWLIAGILVIVGGVFDLFDGSLARATGRVSRLGAFMDSVFDRAGEAIVYLGIVVGCLAAGFDLGAILAVGAMASAFMVSYVRAKSEGLGFSPGSGMAAVGLAPREVRLVILTIGLMAAGLSVADYAIPTGFWLSVGGIELDAGHGYLALALAVIAILATITTIQRIVHVMNQAAHQEDPNYP
jgi:phosphatidylglycerophosphate synthase